MQQITEDQLIEAVEKVRRDKHDPWRYILFTLLNGIAWGLGMGLGLTIIMGLVVYVLTNILSHMVDFPVVGEYVKELMTLIETYVKQTPRTR